MASPDQTSCGIGEDEQALLRSLVLEPDNGHYDEDSGDDDECCSQSAGNGKKAEKAKWTVAEVRSDYSHGAVPILIYFIGRNSSSCCEDS